MRADIQFDENDYVIQLNTNSSGEYELPDGFDFGHSFCYHLVDGELVLDTEMATEIDAEDARQEEIGLLKRQLALTDDDMLAFVEDLFSLKNPLTFISDMFNLMKNYATLVATRQSIREQIRGLTK